MIARPLPPIPHDDRPERAAIGTRAGRSAVGRRRARTRRERYAGLARVFTVIATFVFVVVVYLGLMANVTRMNYELGKLAHERARLLDETSANEDAIANAASNEALKKIAHRLHMREPSSFAAIAAPRDQPDHAPSGIAFLGWLK